MCDLGQELGNLGDSLGNTANNAVNWVVNEVVDPVVNTIDTVVQAALDNPAKTIAQIAAISTGNAWALPLIEGADVAAKGGDIGDVLEATAKAYVAQEVGSYVGGKVSPAAAKATGSAVAGQIIGGGAAGAAVAITTGQDPVKAFISGGVSAGTSAMFGKINENTNGNFAKLPPTVQNVIKTAIIAKLTNNPRPNEAIINSLIASSGIVTEAINSFDPDGTKLDKTQRAILTDVLMGTTTAALSGGNPNAAFTAALIKNGAKALGDMATDAFKNAAKSADTSYKTAETKANQLDTNEAAQKTALKNYNDTATELKGKIATQNMYKANYDMWATVYNNRPTKENADSANASAKRYNDYVTVLNKEYTDTYKPALEKYGGELDKLKETHAVLKGDYEDAIQAFATNTDTLSDTLKPTYVAIEKIFVETLDPNFNAAEYKKLNGLPTNTSAYDHYLTKGQTEGLLTNNKAAESSFSAERMRLIQELADKKGISLSQIDDADAKTFFANVNTKYGGDLNALKNASIQDLLTGNTKTLDDLLKISKSQDFKVEINGVNQGGWNPPKNYDVPAGMKLATEDEFADNTAVLDYDKDGKSVWISVDKGITTWNPETLTLTYKKPLFAWEITSESLKNDDPKAWLIAANQIKYDGDNAVTKFLYEYAENVMNYAKSTGNDTIMNTAGNVLKAGGGILQSFNGLVVLAGLNPNSTATGKFAEKLVSLGKATTTAEYQAAVADMNKTMGSGKGIIGTGKAIWGAFKDHPVEFLAEIVGVEGMQELVPLLIGGGATTAVKGLALARGMGTKLAAEWSTKAGISAAVATDIAESVGGSAEGAFNQAYKLALSKGMTEAQATKIALEIAGKTGLTSGVITALSMKVGGGALEKAILGKAGNGELANVIDALAKKMAEGGKVTVKEGVSEGIEEGLSAAYLEGQLYQLDPTRDVVGNITSNTIIGAIAGGGVAGGAYAGANTGSVVANLLITSNPHIAQVINSSPFANAALQKLRTLGITDTNLQANLLNNKYDADFTSTEEATDALRSRTDFTYSDADINALTGRGTDTTLASRVDTYVDPKVLDIEEVKAAAKAEGYTLTDAEAAKLIGQKDEAAGVAAVKTQYDPLAVTEQEAKDFFKAQGYTPTAADLAAYTGNKKESDTKAAIATKYDPLATTKEEAEWFFKRQNYTPTSEELAAYIGNKKESDTKAAIDTKYDPLATTEVEAKAFFKSIGYTPTSKELAAYIGNKKEADIGNQITAKYDPLAVTEQEAKDFFKAQGYTPTAAELAAYVGNKKEANTKAAIDTKYDPLAVTEQEAKDFFATQGYTPTAKELAAYVGNKKESDTKSAIATKYDPLAVTEQEAKDFFKSIGYTPTAAELAAYVGNKKEADIKTAIDTKYDPLATTEAEAKAFFKAQRYTPTAAELAAYVGNKKEADIGNQITAKYDPLATTEAEAKDFFKSIGYTPTAADIAAYIGNKKEADTQTAINTKYDPLATTESEAKDFFKAQGYTPTAKELAAYVGNKKEADTQTAINTKYDPLAVTEQEAKDFFASAGYTPTAEELAAYVGNKKEANTQTAINTKYDSLGVSEAEAKDFFKSIGYTPTAEELAAYVGNKKEADTKTAINTKYDALATTEAEAKAFFAAQGYTPTAEELAAYVGNKKQGEMQAAINAKYDPLAVTEQEAKDFFKAQGYTPTAEELAAYIGNKKEADIKTAIDTKYDPLAVTKEEATAAAKAENYTLTDEEIANYIGNKSETDTLAAIIKYVDPNAVTEAEAKAFFAEQGYPPSTEELAAYIGQKSEAQIAKDVATYADPKAVTAAEAKAFFDSQGYPATDAQIAQFTKVADETQVGKDVAAYVDPRQVTYTEAETFLKDLGYNPTKEEINKFVTSSADTIQTAIKGDVTKYVDPLLVDKDEVKQAFIDAGFEDVTDADVEKFIGQYAEKDLSGKVTDYLPIATYNKTAEQIASIKTDILSRVAEYETAGKTRDEALSLAIGDVAADLGTTRENILNQIGAPAVADDPATKDINEAKPATGIYGELGNIKTDVQTKYDSLTTEQKNLADQLTKQGVDLNTAISTVTQNVQNLQNVVGQDIQQATQSDLDAVIKMLETQGAYDPQYDYNGDKVIDQNDKTAIQEYIRSQEPGYTPDTDTPFIYNPAAGSKWARTGVFKTIEEQGIATRQAAIDEAEKTRQANAAAALKTQRTGNLNNMLNMLGQAEDTGGQQVTVKPADPAKIGYVYDFNSIFANPAQANMFVSPYAEGGLVDGSDDVNEELLKILKG